VAALRRHVGAAEVMAVVKSDGYGHGMLASARASLAGGATWLGVVHVADAIALREAGISVPVLSLHETMAHPHLRARGTVRRVTDRDIGPFDIPGLAAKFSRWTPAADLKADRLGEHNEEILRDILGLNDAEIRELYRGKTIVHDPLLERLMPGTDKQRAAAIE